MILLIDCVCQTICDISKNTVCHPVIFPAQKVMHDWGGGKHFEIFQDISSVCRNSQWQQC